MGTANMLELDLNQVHGISHNSAHVQMQFRGWASLEFKGKRLLEEEGSVI